MKIVSAMQQYPTLVIELQGQISSRAINAYNEELALRHARSARNYLIRKGIAPERMTISTFNYII